GAAMGFGSIAAFVQRASPALDRRVQSAHTAARSRDRAEPRVHDKAMQQIYQLLDLIAPSRLSVLVLGETGVGKEVFAETVHARSPRRSAPLVKLNCAALPDSLLEAELFGYERGAFTGAMQAKPGLFEAGDKGTVFLDEVGELPLATQAKLLRV